jgi:hypothetical protein
MVRSPVWVKRRNARGEQMFSGLLLEADVAPCSRQVCFVPILLQKSFWGGERKFLEPLMRLMLGDVRDRMASSKIAHRPTQWGRKAMQKRRGLEIDFGEIF